MAIESKLRSLEQRELVVFDFDETIVDCNSDSWIHQLAPNGCIPDQLQYRQGQDYFNHVQAVLDYLHELKVSRQDYEECLALMPAVPGMTETLIERLAREPDRYHMIILSDSNSFFIDAYLESSKLRQAFHTVLTNQATWDPATGRLQLREFHVQDQCKLSSRNLCKGQALKNFIGQQMLDQNTVYSRINYVGDGQNDFCPSSKLGPRDRVFPRANYPLHRLCTRLRQETQLAAVAPSSTEAAEPEAEAATAAAGGLQASVVPWTRGGDILRVILGADEELASQ